MAAALIDSSYVTRSCGSMCVCVHAHVCANPSLYWVNRGSPVRSEPQLWQGGN